MLLDTGVLVVIYLLFSFGIGMLIAGGLLSRDLLSRGPLPDAAFLAPYLLYSTLEVFTEATPGKMLLGLIIRQRNGGPAPFAALVTRWAIKSSPALVSVLEPIVPDDVRFTLELALGLVVLGGCALARGGSKQALHDRIAGTAVFRVASLGDRLSDDEVEPDRAVRQKRVGVSDPSGLASLARRGLAFGLDLLALWVLISLIRGVEHRQPLSSPELLALLIVAFYEWLLGWGVTPGKAWVGIHVVMQETPEHPGRLRMFLREGPGKLISGLPLGFGFLWAVWDRRRQAWHDKLVGTVVVTRHVEGVAEVTARTRVLSSVLLAYGAVLVFPLWMIGRSQPWKPIVPILAALPQPIAALLTSIVTLPFWPLWLVGWVSAAGNRVGGLEWHTQAVPLVVGCGYVWAAVALLRGDGFATGLIRWAAGTQLVSTVLAFSRLTVPYGPWPMGVVGGPWPGPLTEVVVFLIPAGLILGASFRIAGAPAPAEPSDADPQAWRSDRRPEPAHAWSRVILATGVLLPWWLAVTTGALAEQWWLTVSLASAFLATPYVVLLGYARLSGAWPGTVNGAVEGGDTEREWIILSGLVGLSLGLAWTHAQLWGSFLTATVMTGTVRPWWSALVPVLLGGAAGAGLGLAVARASPWQSARAVRGAAWALLVVALVGGLGMAAARLTGHWAGWEITRAVRSLRDPSFAVRLEGVKALARLGPRADRAVLDLAAALDDDESLVREGTADLLRRLGPAAAPAVPALRRALRQWPDPQWWWAADALASVERRSTAGLPAVSEALAHPDARDRGVAAASLRFLGEPAIPIVAQALSDPDRWVRLLALYALRQIVWSEPRLHAAAAALLAEAAKDPFQEIRYLASEVQAHIQATPR